MSEGTCPDQNENERKLRGWMFSMICALVFILPIVLAILGSLLFPLNKTYGLLAGLVGFLMGGGISAVITRITKVEQS